MFGKGPRLDPLESAKQLLITGSELNRAQLSLEWRTLACEVGRVVHQAKTVGAWASSALLLTAALTALRRSTSEPVASRISWFKRILEGARLASTAWLAFRGRGRKPERPEQ